MNNSNPEQSPLEREYAQRRQQLSTAAILALMVTFICLVIICVGAFATGGAAFILLRRQHQLVLPMVGMEQARATPTSMPQVPTSTPRAITSITATPVVIPASPAVLPTLTEPAPSEPTSTPVSVITSSVSVTQTELQMRVFYDLWQSVNDYYIYEDFNGLDWSEVRATYEISISAGIGTEAFYDLMRQMVYDLNDDHSYFISPEEALQEEESYRGDGEYAGVGIISDFNFEKKYAFVLQVLPDSPAMLAGIKAHDHILTINGMPSIDDEGNPALYMLRGAEGTTATVTVRTPGESPRELELTRATLSASMPVEHRLLPGNKRIGYLLIPTFYEEGIGQRVRAALRDLTRRGRLDGLVIDMRINGGGAYPILMQNLRFFTSGNVGYLVNRQSERTVLTARAERISNLQTTPLVILIGPATQSYAEVYAGILRERGRATLVGQPSGGNIETLRQHVFEDGSQAWLAEETFILPDGSGWEGSGLTPDVLIDQNWDEFTADSDPMLAAAIEELTKER